jgi:hypothetical protein
MTRILLVLVTLAASGVLLWSSWRFDRRLFAALAVVFAAVLTALVLQLLDTREDEWQPLPADQVRLKLRDQHVTESGVRLTGTLENRGERPVGRVTARIQVADCSGDGPCRVLAEAPMDLRLQVPPRKTYPFTDVIRMTVSKGAEQQRWQAEVKSVYAYRR